MCPSDSELLRLMTGELPEPEATRARDHVEVCAACRHRLAEDRRVWEMLGSLSAELPPADLAPAILARAERDTALPSRLRIAAAVLLAVGGGVVIGTAVPVRGPGVVATSTNEGA